MVTKIIEFESPKLKDPIFIEGLPGIGTVGRIAAGHLIEELKAKKFAELHSSHFPFVVMTLSNSQIHLLKAEFYYYKAKKKNEKDLIILVGDSQSIDGEGHYEIVTTILDYIKKFKVKEMFTLAGLGIGERVENPRVIGAVSDTEMIKKYKDCGIIFDDGKRIGNITGAAGLLIGIGKYYGIKGICLLGETAGWPLLPDHKAAEAVIKVLSKMLKMEINVSKLEKRAREMEEFIRKIQEVERRSLAQLVKERPKEKEGEPTYIG